MIEGWLLSLVGLRKDVDPSTEYGIDEAHEDAQYVENLLASERAWHAARAWTPRKKVCAICYALVDAAGTPLSPQPPLPSRSRGDDTSFVWFAFAICCKRCELRHGRVIEFRDGFAFLGRDGELNVLLQGTVYAVNTETLERKEVER
jgi:hypothetical protein